ncbi:MAG: hypothetical protein AAF224_09435 [Pseudomonadota bacterium]
MRELSRLKAIAAGVFPGSLLFSGGVILALIMPKILVENEFEFAKRFFDQGTEGFGNLMLIFLISGFLTSALAFPFSSSARKNFLSYLSTSALGGFAATIFLPWQGIVPV